MSIIRTILKQAIRYDRQVAVYLCCLFRAGFKAPDKFKVRFSANNKNVRAIVNKAVGSSIEPQGSNKRSGTLELTLEQASLWWEKLWEVYTPDIGKKPSSKDKDLEEDKNDDEEIEEWADDDLKALLAMLTGETRNKGRVTPHNGYKILQYMRLKPLSSPPVHAAKAFVQSADTIP